MAAVIAPSAPPTDLEALKSGVMDTFPVQESVGPKRIALKVSECPVEEVTVFTDRAEVTRAVSVVAPSIGQYDVIIEGVTKLAVADSFRVNGTGPCRILEVSYHDEEVKEEDKSAEVAAIQNAIQAVRDKLTRIESSLAVHRGSLQLVDAFAEATITKPLQEIGLPPRKKPFGPKVHVKEVVEGDVEDDSEDSTAGVSQKGRRKPLAVEYVEKLLDMRLKRFETADELLRGLELEKKARTEEVVDLTKKLTQLKRGLAAEDVAKNVIVSLQVSEVGPIELRLVYLVSGNASWSPSYDVRVSSTEGTLNITYYGRILQSTGEDWKEARITLSTASPSVGGTPPTLAPTRYAVGWKPQPPRPAIRRSRYMKTYNEDCEMESIQAQVEELNGFASDIAAEIADQSARLEKLEDKVCLAQPTRSPAEAASAVGSAATFLIDRAATIDSDDKPHKVVIGVFDMPATFRYYCVPKQAPQAYVQAICSNTSEYTMLASDIVNVFVDGNFVSTTSIPNVSPSETFRSFLGVDAAVRVEYRDFGSKSSFSGVVFKHRVMTHKFATTIRNTKPFPIHVVLADVLPASQSTRVVVNVVEPPQGVIDEGTASEAASRAGGAFEDFGVGEVKSGEGPFAGVTFRDVVAKNPLTNNLVWSRKVPANSSVVIPFEYRVETDTSTAYYVQ